MLQGKESVGFNTATCNFVTNKLWQRSQDLSERLHPESLCFTTRNLDIACLTLHLSARTELPSGAARVVDQQTSAVGRQTHCPRSDGRSRAGSVIAAARRENSRGEPSDEHSQWEQPRGSTASRNGSREQQTHLVGTDGKPDERQQEAVANEKYQD